MRNRLIDYDIITTRTSEELTALVQKYLEKGWQPHGPVRKRTHTNAATGEESVAYWCVMGKYGERKH